MRRLTGIFLLMACATTAAEVYRQVGPDGSVSFSDTPAPGAERVQVSPAQSVRLPSTPARATGAVSTRGPAGDRKSPDRSYDSFAIAEPAEGQGIRSNDGSVTVLLSLQPALMPGHLIELTVSGEDGEKVHRGSALKFSLSALSRGEHRVSARVKNGRGEPVMVAPGVRFYVLRVAAGG